MSKAERADARRLDFAAAMWLALARLAMSLAVVCVCLASYAWWGSPASPLGSLWPAAPALVPAWLLFLALHRRALKRLLAMRPGPELRVGFLDTLSTVGIRKLDGGEEDDA